MIYMKKLIAIAVVLALVAGVAFAQTANGISVQGWGRGAFSPIIYAGPEQENGETKKVPDPTPTDPNHTKEVEGETFTGAGASWGGSNIRVDFRINGNSDFVGFSINATAENDKLSAGDNGTNIWAKPFGNDYLKLMVGSYAEDTLRGKIGNLDGGFSSMVGCGTPEEDAIFTRFGMGGVNTTYGVADHGYMLSSAPIEGLFIGLSVNGAYDPGWNGATKDATLAAHAFQYMQIGAGYNIADIGHIRAQYIGGWSGTKDLTKEEDIKYFTAATDTGKLARIEAAFALTAVEGLLVDLGGKFWLPLEVKNEIAGTKFSTTYSKGVDLSLGATFNSGDFGIGFRFDAESLGAYAGGRSKTDGSPDDKVEDQSTMIIRVVPTYAIGSATIGLDIAFKIVGEGKYGLTDEIANPDNKNGDGRKDNTSQIAFGAFVSKGLGNGNIRAGLSYALPPNNSDGKANGIGVFKIPVILEYAFF
jgi:hypothetical protein